MICSLAYFRLKQQFQINGFREVLTNFVKGLFVLVLLWVSSAIGLKKHSFDKCSKSFFGMVCRAMPLFRVDIFVARSVNEVLMLMCK